MPHGVLFRGGEEREARRHFIDHGYLEAVIGLPAGLFYGTGIPACVLVMNKQGAAKRKHVFFINADREYREGKAQNFLRPEDMAKIVQVYRAMQDVEGYAKLVPVAEIEAEDYNCNIRRYVDNAPPPEPHDVRAHLHGGVPVAEIEALGHFWRNYPGLRVRVFQPRPAAAAYADYPGRERPRALAEIVKTDPDIAQAHARFLSSIRWATPPHVEALAPTDGKQGNATNAAFSFGSIVTAFGDQQLLNDHQIRGALARYFELFKPEFKSIAFSGWGPELIPDSDILQSQFPEVLAEMERKRARLAELAALFATADEEDYEDSDDTGVLPADEVKRLRPNWERRAAPSSPGRKAPGRGRRAHSRSRRRGQARPPQGDRREQRTLQGELRATEKKRRNSSSRAPEDRPRRSPPRLLERFHRELSRICGDYLRRSARLPRRPGKPPREVRHHAQALETQRAAATAKLHGFLKELGMVGGRVASLVLSHLREPS